VTSLRGGNVHHNGEYRGSDPLIISGLSDFRGSGGKVIGPRPFLQSQKKSYFTKNEFIFQMHNPGEPLTRESGWDRACIVWAGFCKYCRCCYREDAGIQKESRPVQLPDQMSTLLHDNTLNFFSWGCCAGVLSPGNKPRIFYIPWFFSCQVSVIKDNSILILKKSPEHVFLS
jgi:hypothetical protein